MRPCHLRVVGVFAYGAKGPYRSDLVVSILYI